MGLWPPHSIEEFEGIPIVCLCGSAGALAAYIGLLEHLDANTGMAFVVVSHRARECSNLLPELLTSKTKMPVMDIEHGTRIEPNSVLIGPPHLRMTTNGMNVHLHHEFKAQGWPTLITDFLRSVARLGGSRAVAVILSGMGDDGSAALGAVKASGGTVIVQSDPLYDSMPRQAIATGYVDLILSPAQIGKHLSRMKVSARKLSSGPKGNVCAF